MAFNLETWVDEFLQQPQQRMDTELTKVLLTLTFMEIDQAPLPPETLTNFSYQIIDKRATYIGLDLTDYAKVLISSLVDSPGAAVMYLYVLRTKGKKHSVVNIVELFPFGFPTEDSLQRMWDKQKGHFNDEKVDNCLDNLNFTWKDM